MGSNEIDAQIEEGKGLTASAVIYLLKSGLIKRAVISSKGSLGDSIENL